MKRFWLSFLILLIPFCFINSQNLKIEREIDLSFFLKPYQPQRVFAAIDSLGNIFITQLGKDSFIKFDPTGEVILKAPQKIEGDIREFDIDNYGNPACVFTGTLAGSSFYLPVVWFDGITGKKIREINLGEIFSFVANMRILRPKDIILINGIAKNESLRKYSLHLVDFNGNHLRSFSPFKQQKGDIPDLIDENRDFFASRPQIDPNNMTIFQSFPATSRIQYFDYSGDPIGETEWLGKNTFLIHAGNLWIADSEGYRVLEKKGNSFIPTKVRIRDDKKTRVPWDPIASDLSGNIYFLGNKEFQTLKIYALK